MIPDLRPYPAMKDSGVEWLGEVPEHWDTRPLKRWVRMNAAVLPETTVPDHEFRYVDIGSVGTGVLTQKPQRLRFGSAPSRARRVVCKGDTIISTVRTYLKAVYFVDRDAEELICSTGFAVLTPRLGTLPKFVSYLARSDPFTNRVTADSVGIAYPAIVETRLGSFHVAVPPLPEQSAIVRFLDHVDRRIRRYIRAKQKLITLLEEQRQAIIHRAVTRGLDPDVRLKPSGVEWLGDVPAHWEVVRSSRLVMLTTGFPFTSEGFSHDEGDIRLLRGINIAPGRIRWEAAVRWPTSQARDFVEYALREGDIVLGMDRPIVRGGVRVAVIGRADVPSLVLQRVARIRTRSGLDASFAFLLLGGKSFADYLAPIFTGISVPHISPEQIGSFRIALPPPSEQRRIVNWVQANTLTLKALAESARSELDLLREYRTRLISDVVTGKLDVREAAAHLPEETGEPEPLDETDTLAEDISEETEAPDPDALEEAEA